MNAIEKTIVSSITAGMATAATTGDAAETPETVKLWINGILQCECQCHNRLVSVLVEEALLMEFAQLYPEFTVSVFEFDSGELIRETVHRRGVDVISEFGDLAS
jgi:hypothetical protein